MTDLEQSSYLMLKKLEWSSFQLGQGSGYMSSGGDGPLVRACPVCNQIDPKDPGKRDFMEEAHGHKRSCKLKQLIDAFGGGRRK